MASAPRATVRFGRLESARGIAHQGPRAGHDPPGELDVSSREALERLPEAPLRQRASVVLSKFAAPQRSDALAPIRGRLKLGGDVGRGMTVFARNCKTCHERQGQGHRVGPRSIGYRRQGPRALLTDILDPNREVAPDYVMLTLATRGGQVVSGLLAEETATTLKVRRARASRKRSSDPRSTRSAQRAGR